MACAILNTWTATSAQGASTTVGVSVTTTGANLLVACASSASDAASGGTFTSVSGSTSGAFTTAITESAFPTSFSSGIAYKVVAGAQTETITATFAATGCCKQIVVFEVSGWDTSSPAGATASGGDVATGTDYQISLPVRTPGSLLIFCAGTENSTNTTNPNANSTLVANFVDAATRCCDVYTMIAPDTSAREVGNLDNRTNWGGSALEVRAAYTPPSAPNVTASLPLFRA